MRLPSLAARVALSGLLALAAGCAAERAVTPADARAVRLATALALPTAQSVVLSPSAVTAGATVTGTVTLGAPSPTGGTEVGVSSNDVAAASIDTPLLVVPAGATSATFTITTHPVATTAYPAISATANQVTQTAVLTVSPGGVTVASLAVAPTLVAGGSTATGTVTLTGAAPAGGAAVALGTGDPAIATVPASVVVPAGATTATFTITPGTVAASVGVNVTASYGGVTVFARLFVSPPPPTGPVPTSVVVAPSEVVGGTPAQGTVTIASAVGTPTTIALASTTPSVATVPASVTVPAGATSAAFTVSTLPNTANQGLFSVITATANGAQASATIQTVPAPQGPFVQSVAFTPTVTGGGGGMTGTVRLTGVSTQGTVVQLRSSRPEAASVPPEVVVQPGQSSVAFPVTTFRVAANVAVTITAFQTFAAGGPAPSASGTVTITTAAPPSPDIVRIESAVFKPGGRGGTLTVKATSTNPDAILTVFRGSATTPSATMVNLGGGKYQVSFSFSGSAPATATVKSNFGGSATATVKK